MDGNNVFGRTLNKLRQERNLTVRELARLAEISQPLVSNLQNGHRVIGEYTARKIGAALQLHGKELNDFIYLAINQCAEKVLKTSLHYPAEILNLVAVELGSLGISPAKIARCVRRTNEDADTTLHLNDGKSARINVEVVIQ